MSVMLKHNKFSMCNFSYNMFLLMLSVFETHYRLLWFTEIKLKFNLFVFVLSKILGGNERKIDNNIVYYTLQDHRWIRDIQISGGQITEVGLYADLNI